MIAAAPTKSKAEKAATSNACKVCAPLGASLVFRGVEGCLPFLHGSQGCSTYIRRYMIGHFREPVDIACSNFSEHSAVFGGEDNLKTGVANVVKTYEPKVIGIASTCLAETIGDDLPAIIKRMVKNNADLPELVTVSTPSYTGTHAEGFAKAVEALARHFADGETTIENQVNVFAPMVSPADLRALRYLVEGFGLHPAVIPDYSDTLDGPAWDDYQVISEGGTTTEELRATGTALASMAFAETREEGKGAAGYLASEYSVEDIALPLPIGIEATDKFIAALERISGRPAPKRLMAERGRLVDAYVDAHKYAFGRKVLIYGEEDLVIAMARFAKEIGLVPAICASGADSGKLASRLEAVGVDPFETAIIDDADFVMMEREAKARGIDMLIGHSKGYWLARRMDIPLVRVGFPIQDRIGGARVRLLGYDGAHDLFDRIVNAIIEREQTASPVGYMAM